MKFRRFKEIKNMTTDELNKLEKKSTDNLSLNPTLKDDFTRTAITKLLVNARKYANKRKIRVMIFDED